MTVAASGRVLLLLLLLLLTMVLMRRMQHAVVADGRRGIFEPRDVRMLLPLLMRWQPQLLGLWQLQLRLSALARARRMQMRQRQRGVRCCSGG